MPQTHEPNIDITGPVDELVAAATRAIAEARFALAVELLGTVIDLQKWEKRVDKIC